MTMQLASLVAVAALAIPPATPAPQVTTTGLPPGWFPAGDHPADYEMSVDPRGGRTGKACAFIKSRATATAPGFGTLMQTFDAAEYRGKRLRLSAYVKAAGILNWAGLWMRIDGERPPGAQGPAMLGFDNMQGRPIKGTADWTRHDVVLDVPNEAKAIAFGILLSGPGEAWLDELAFDAVGPEVPLTGMGATLAKKPNLTFQR